MFFVNNGLHFCDVDVVIVHELSSYGEFCIHIVQYERNVLQLDWLELYFSYFVLFIYFFLLAKRKKRRESEQFTVVASRCNLAKKWQIM